MKDLAACNAKDVKNAAGEERERKVLLCRRTVRIEVKSKVILLKLKEEGCSLGQ